MSIHITGGSGYRGVTVVGPPTSGTYALGQWVISQSGQMWVCTEAGAPGCWVTPSDVRDLLDVGEETLSRTAANSNSQTLGNGQLRMSYFVARKSETTTQVRIMSGGIAAAPTPTLCRLGLYGIAADGAGTLVASTPNDTSLLSITSTSYVRSWSAPYAKVAGHRYALGILIVTSFTVPQVQGATQQSYECSFAPRLTGFINSVADLPATFVAGDLSNSGLRMYGVILP